MFFSPFMGRQYVIQRKDDLDQPDWTDESSATLTPMGSGLVEAVFAKPAGGGAFYRAMVLPPAAIYSEDFESGATGWTHGGDGDNWELGTPVNGPGMAFSGANVYATGLNDNIQPYSDAYLHSPAIDLTGVSRATLSYEEWLNIDPDVTFHNATVRVLDASSMDILQEFPAESGMIAPYTERRLQLSPQVLGHSVILEFRLECDAYNLLEGWYIDDVKILPE